MSVNGIVGLVMLILIIYFIINEIRNRGKNSEKNKPESWSKYFKYSLALAGILIVFFGIYAGLIAFALFWGAIALVRNLRGKL